MCFTAAFCLAFCCLLSYRVSRVLRSLLYLDCWYSDQLDSLCKSKIRFWSNENLKNSITRIYCWICLALYLFFHWISSEFSSHSYNLCQLHFVHCCMPDTLLVILLNSTNFLNKLVKNFLEAIPRYRVAQKYPLWYIV